MQQCLVVWSNMRIQVGFLELPLLGPLGGQPLGSAVIVHKLVTRVDKHHPRNIVRVLIGEQACRLARE